jgi:uncharacterized membrane protein YjjP (DUF1212 family)
MEATPPTILGESLTVLAAACAGATVSLRLFAEGNWTDRLRAFVSSALTGFFLYRVAAHYLGASPEFHPPIAFMSAVFGVFVLSQLAARARADGAAAIIGWLLPLKPAAKATTPSPETPAPPPAGTAGGS